MRAVSRRAAPLFSAGVVAILLAGCGASGPSTGGSPAPPNVSAPPDSASAAPSAAVSAGGPSASLFPTFTRVADLEALLPSKVAGTAVQASSLTGNDILATGRPEDIAALNRILDDTGRKASDYAFAYVIASGSSVVGVFRVTGADPTKVRDSLIAQSQAVTKSASVDSGIVGGKPVQILRATAADGTLWSTYYLPKGDVLYFVQTVDPKVAQEVLAGL